MTREWKQQSLPAHSLIQKKSLVNTEQVSTQPSIILILYIHCALC